MRFNYPSLCIDNFYSDPDKVREFALSQTFYESDDGRWPGRRTEGLYDIDKTFFDLCTYKILTLFYTEDEIKQGYTCDTMFQLIPPYDNVKDSSLNDGWIHYDEIAELAAIIYLTPNIDVNSGTSLFLPKKSKQFVSNDDHYLYKSLFYKHRVTNFFDNKTYSDAINYHNDHFIEVSKYQNVYNRMICFDSKMWHKANSFFSENEPRLTQVFFFNITSDIQKPLERNRKYL